MDGAAIQLAIDVLNDGLVSIPKTLFKKYRQLGLVETELVVLLQLYTLAQEGILLPKVTLLGELTTLSPTAVSDQLHSLIKRDFLSLDQYIDENGLQAEKYSLRPLWKKIIELSIQEMSGRPPETEYDRLFPVFEREFARPLSPLESEILVKWIDEDHYSAELIEAALREAVFGDKLSFRYIDRVLIDWQRKGIKTARASSEYARQFREKKPQTVKPAEQPLEEFTFYNWVK